MDLFEYIRKINDYWVEWSTVQPDVGAFVATILISLAPCMILYLIPMKYCRDDSYFMRFLLSFSSGTLLADAMLHLIPHSIVNQLEKSPPVPHCNDLGSHVDAVNQTEHIASRNDHCMHQNQLGVEIVYLYVIGGFVSFFMLEKSFLLCKSLVKRTNIKNNKNKQPTSDNVNVKIGALLNLTSDFSHNFIDGLAIAASFLSSPSLGITTTIGVFFHEIPHEIGDFAILVKSGLSKYTAILVQLVTALGALLGTYVGVYYSVENGQIPDWLLPFTAGGFIYISAVSVLSSLMSFDPKISPIIHLTDVFGMILGTAAIQYIHEKIDH